MNVMRKIAGRFISLCKYSLIHQSYSICGLLMNLYKPVKRLPYPYRRFVLYFQ